MVVVVCVGGQREGRAGNWVMRGAPLLLDGLGRGLGRSPHLHARDVKSVKPQQSHPSALIAYPNCKIRFAHTVHTHAYGPTCVIVHLQPQVRTCPTPRPKVQS
eukprot:6118704-Pleurochrysis_carterae.AAC.1